MRRNTLLPALVVLSLAAGFGMHGADVAESPADPHVAELIQQLDNEYFLKREEASDQLEGLGERALPALRKAVAGNESFEVRWRAQRLLAAPQRKSRSTGLSLVLIGTGPFQMGSPESEEGRRPDELQHRVRIGKPFYLGAYEVTQDEYRQVMVSSPSWFASSGGGSDKVAETGTTRFPVESVSWFDALEFCNQLSRLDKFEPYYRLTDLKREAGSIESATVAVGGGYGYRLPTEAEWEYACRAGTLTPFHFGGGSNGHAANVQGVTTAGGYGGVVKGPNLGRATTVGSYAPNAWGLFDMHGNVGEWCWDWHDRDYYAVSPASDPAGPEHGQQRAFRGGSWLLGEVSCRSASRLSQTPDECKNYLGFRVARDP